jgi:hypothetical protein
VLSKWVTAIIAAAISAFACGVVAQYGTPIDAALPLIAVIITIVTAVSSPSIQLAVPLLMGGEIAIADERMRLLWFGVVIGAAFASALMLCDRHICLLVITVCAIVLLRWIPIANVTVWREVVLIAIALLIVETLRPGPVSVAIAVAVALFTPLIPLRTLGFSIVVVIAIAILRVAGMPELKADSLASLSLALMLMFFAWSGVFARATPLVVHGMPSNAPRSPLRMALAPGESVVVVPPQDATALILSGANISRLRTGTIVGSINRVPLRVGEIADWGFLRRDHFYGSRNVVPDNPAGDLRDYGQVAWVDGAARFPIPHGAKSVLVTADSHLPRNARLQIDAFELVRR